MNDDFGNAILGFAAGSTLMTSVLYLVLFGWRRAYRETLQAAIAEGRMRVVGNEGWELGAKEPFDYLESKAMQGGSNPRRGLTRLFVLVALATTRFVFLLPRGQ